MEIQPRDLRRTAATVVQIVADPPCLGEGTTLNHSDGDVTAIYGRRRMFEELMAARFVPPGRRLGFSSR